MLNKKVAFASLFPCLSGLGFLVPKSTTNHYKIMVNYNGQADLLLSLQIFPDYYPYQFKKTALYDYLTDIDKYLVADGNVSEKKKTLKNRLQKRIRDLLDNVKEFGPSLWNEDLYDTGLVFKNDQQWSNRSTSILFLEQFIADDFTDINDSTNGLPTYKDLIITNYRAARDPYTIFPEKVFKCFEKEGIEKTSSVAKSVECDDQATGNWKIKAKELAEKFKEYIENFKKDDINSLYRFGRYIQFWNKLFKKAGTNLEELGLKSWLKEKSLFALESDKDKALAEMYSKIIFDEEEITELNKWSKSTESESWKAHYLSLTSANSLAPTLAHHPALEQTVLPGSAPLAEGSQKEVIVFLFQFAALIEDYVKNKKDTFEVEFKGDDRYSFMQNALKNAKAMAKNLETRIEAIRKYFQAIGVVDPNFDPKTPTSNSGSKSFAIVTYPPSSFGAGEATIQSMSKFPFLYSDIGLKQVFPNNLKPHSDDGHKHNWEEEIFSVDDNGWWWKIGNVDIDSSNLFKFEKQADSLLVLANPEDWNLINDKNAVTLKSLGALLKENKTIETDKVNSPKYPVSYQKYHLWNEGLRSPIALNLLLDNLVQIFQRQYDPNFENKSKETNGKDCYQLAMDWGDYWYDAFINAKSCDKEIVKSVEKCEFKEKQ